MSSDNPTLAAANEATGMEPLNQGPNEPQLPKDEVASSTDDIPAALTSLPSGQEYIVLPLDLGSRTNNNQTVSSLPSASEFEDLVRAKIRPAGPARAEEGNLNDYGDLVEKVRQAVDGGVVKVFKLETGVGKREVYVVGLDVDGEKIVGVRIAGA